jgi:hypothetical protein
LSNTPNESFAASATLPIALPTCFQGPVIYISPFTNVSLIDGVLLFDDSLTAYTIDPAAPLPAGRTAQIRSYLL